MAELTSAPSGTVTVTALPPGAWLKDPLDPTRNLALSCVDGPPTWTRPRGQAVLDALGRTDPIVQTDVRRSRRGELSVTPMSQTEADRLDVLLGSARVLLLQIPAVSTAWRGDHAYVVCVGDDTAESLGALDNRTVSVPLVEVRAP